MVSFLFKTYLHECLRKVVAVLFITYLHKCLRKVVAVLVQEVVLITAILLA